MAAGLPVVANPVGMNREMVRDGETGFLASTPVEWARAIQTLANDPVLRARLGCAGREFVQRHYSVSRWSPEFAALIDGLPRELAVPALPIDRFSRSVTIESQAGLERAA
jgi:glycosyltransferase involved in cell wall biosynthesis